MEPEIVPPTVEAIRRWSGVEPPNAAALHGLADMAALIADIEAVRAAASPSRTSRAASRRRCAT